MIEKRSITLAFLGFFLYNDALKMHKMRMLAMLESIKSLAQTSLDSVNRSSKDIIHFLDKLSGALVGVTLFTLTSLLLNLVIALAVFTLTLAARVVLPVAVALWAFKTTHSIPMSLFGAVVMLGVDRIIVPPLLFITGARLVLKVVQDMGHTIPHGLTEGYTKGLVNIIKQWWDTPFSFLNYLNTTRRDESEDDGFELPSFSVFNRLSAMQPRARRDEGLFPGQEEAERQSFEHSQPSTSLNKLTPTEFAKFELKQPVAPQKAFVPLSEKELLAAASIPELQTQLGNYNNLYKDLVSYDTKPGDFSDPVMYMDVTAPILLVKQERIAADTWKTMPAYIWLTDKTNLGTWMAANSELPHNRDKLNGKDVSHDNPTRYRYYAYTKGSKNCPELHEMAATIRSKLPASSLGQEVSPQVNTGFTSYLSFSLPSLPSFFSLGRVSPGSEKNDSAKTPVVPTAFTML